MPPITVTFDDLAPMPAPNSTPAGLRILATASELFYLQGITAVGVDLVADTAGVTKRTLYQRFGSKEGLVAAYLQRRAHLWQEHLLAELRRVTPADAMEAVGVLFDATQEWAGRHHRGCAFVAAWVELGPRGGPAVDVIRAEKAWTRRLLERLVDDDLLAHQLQLLHEGAQVSASAQCDTQAFAAAREAARVLVGSCTHPPHPVQIRDCCTIT